MVESKALSRIQMLLDENSFVELGAGITARITDFTLKSQLEPSDGVITGYGQIDGNPVFVYSQNREVLNGTMGEMHAKKIVDLYDKAAKTGAPVIGFIDCGGFRLQESVDALDAFGKLLAKQVECADSLVQINAIFGNCAGGMMMVPAMSDFVFMTKEANAFVNAPATITDDAALSKNYNAASYINEVSGQAQVVDTEAEAIEQIRDLVLMICDDEYGTCDEGQLNRYISQATIAKRDTRALLAECADGTFTEIRPAYCPEMVTGFLKLNGILTGAVGNATALYNEDGEVEKELAKGLTRGGCKKAADFVAFCNRFDIPVLSVTAADGFAKTAATETGLPAALAQLVKAFAEPWNTSVNLIMGDTYGSAYVAMNAKSLGGADMVFAWDDTKVGMMEAEKAANILFASEDAASKEKQAASYEKTQNSVWCAASRGSIDAVIAPKDTRKHLIMAFSML